MTTPDTTLLRTSLDQFATLAGEVTDDTVGNPTPCSDWTVGDLVDHVTATTAKFADGLRGGEVDWSAAPTASEDRAAAFRAAGDDLVAAWHEAGDDVKGPGQDWHLAELAVHTWDLATGLGRPTGGFDQQVAETGLAFMEANLKDEMRSHAFAPKQPAPDRADAYGRIAAFAGRRVEADPQS